MSNQVVMIPSNISDKLKVEHPTDTKTKNVSCVISLILADFS